MDLLDKFLKELAGIDIVILTYVFPLVTLPVVSTVYVSVDAMQIEPCQSKKRADVYGRKTFDKI